MPAIPLQRAITDPDVFCVTWEQIPGRGAAERQQEAIIANAAAAAASGRIHALGITDNPGGNPSLSAELLCAELVRCGIDPLVHFACRDKNRNAIESLLYGLERCGARNLLIVSGDYPSAEGFCGTSRPVFDLDPVHTLQLVASMNTGLAYRYLGRDARLSPTSFFAGVAISPFKKSEAELAGQYFKLRKKITAGARFAITQIGFDCRKFHELLLWLRQEHYDLPVLANVFVLSHPAAKFMAAGNVPGCVVPPRLLSELAKEHEQPDKGRAARIARAARLYAVVRGMGYAGAHIGGHNLTCDTVLEIIERGEEMHPSWQDILSDCEYACGSLFYYYFQPAPAPQLNSISPAARPHNAKAPFSYRLCSFMHAVVFEPSSPLYRLLRFFARLTDSSRRCRTLAARLEHIVKVVLFHCADCGDCALPDTAYLCPMSRCAKFQRNGPCGGSDDGWCEVYPGEIKCVWVLAYERLKSHQSGIFKDMPIVPPCDWRLWQTSSWLNYYLGRDHASKMHHGNLQASRHAGRQQS